MPDPPKPSGETPEPLPEPDPSNAKVVPRGIHGLPKFDPKNMRDLPRVAPDNSSKSSSSEE